MPPKPLFGRDPLAPPPGPTFAEINSFTALPKPWKNPLYTKNAARRNKTLKQILAGERDRALGKIPEDAQAMIVPQAAIPTQDQGPIITFMSIEAPPSLLPTKRYCDVTGLLAPYKEPKSGLRYNSVEMFELIRQMPPSTHQAYLAVRGSNAVLL